jgi:hypothetical protein
MGQYKLQLGNGNPREIRIPQSIGCVVDPWDIRLLRPSLSCDIVKSSLLQIQQVSLSSTSFRYNARISRSICFLWVISTETNLVCENSELRRREGMREHRSRSSFRKHSRIRLWLCQVDSLSHGELPPVSEIDLKVARTIEVPFSRVVFQ